MDEYPQLKNAPIVEALIDIQVQLPESKTIDLLEGAYEKIKSEFPKQKKRIRFSGSPKIDSQNANKGLLRNTIDGFLFSSENEKKIVQARLDGFTHNVHKPYTNWETLRDDAKKYWKIYKDIAEPVSVKRLALRYINKISLKAPFEPSNYFKTLPVLSPDLNYDTENLFSQLTIKNVKINSFANITEAIEIVDSETVQFIFDIDVFKLGEYTEETMWGHFEELRKFKNEIFFKSITPTALKLLS